MVNGAILLRTRSLYLGGKGSDAFVQVRDGKRIQIFARQGLQEVARARSGRGILEIHGRMVARMKRQVNAPCRSVSRGIKTLAAESAHCHKARNAAKRVVEGADMAMAGTMRAIEIRAAGGPDMLELADVPVPVPGPGDVLIQVEAAGVNRPDILQREGRYPVPPDASPLPGLEVAGRIAAVGEGVDSGVIGHRVCALVAGGGYADYAVTPHAQCFAVPAAMSAEHAAALPETLMTVWHNLFERAYVGEGERVLIHGGTSGIGTMAISLCKAFGIETIVTCGSDEKCAAAVEWGATHAVNYKTDDFVEAVKRMTGGSGVNAVLDMVGGDYLPRNLACLADDGRHVSIAVLGGPKAELFIPQMMTRRLTLTGSTLRPRSPAFKAALCAEIREIVWPLFAEGALKPAMDRVFPLAEAAEAHRRMEAGDHFGKIVLKVS